MLTRYLKPSAWCEHAILVLLLCMPLSSSAQSAAEKNLGGKWEKVDLGNDFKGVSIDQLAVVKHGNAVALDLKTGNLYRLGKGGLKLMVKGVAINVSAALDETIVAIKNDNTVWINRDEEGNLLEGNELRHWKDAPQLTSVSVANKDSMIGLYEDESVTPKRIAIWKYENGSWNRAKSADGKDAEGLSGVWMNAVGTAFAVDDMGKIYKTGEEGVPVTKKVEEKKEAKVSAESVATKPVKKKAEPKKMRDVANPRAASLEIHQKKPVGHKPKEEKRAAPVAAQAATSSNPMGDISEIMTKGGGKTLDSDGQSKFQAALTQLYNECPKDDSTAVHELESFLNSSQNNAMLDANSKALVKKYLQELTSGK